MAGQGLALGYAAGGAAASLGDLIKQRFLERQAAAENALRQQAVEQQGQYQTILGRSVEEERQARADLLKQQQTALEAAARDRTAALEYARNLPDGPFKDAMVFRLMTGGTYSPGAATTPSYQETRIATPKGPEIALFNPKNPREPFVRTGERPYFQPQASTIIGPTPPQPTTDYYVEQILKDPRNWSLVSGDKALAKSVRDAMAKRGVDVARVGQTTKDAAVFARTVMPHLQQILPRVRQLEQTGALGPIAGRWNDFLTGKWGGGAADPKTAQEYAKLRVSMGLLQTALGRVHGGARGGGSVIMLEHFKNLLNARAMDPTVLRASLEEAEDWLRGYATMDLPEMGGQAETPSAPAATHKYVPGQGVVPK